MKPRRGFAILAVAALGACSDASAPARAQWKVYVSTDAPVPSLGQELLLELIDSAGNDAPAGTARFVDASRPELWPVSFGILPSEGAPPRVRARLYRLAQTGPDGRPHGASLLDATAQLPAVGPGVTEVTVTLPMACFGVAPDLAGRRTCNPATGQLAPEPTLGPLTDASTLPRASSWPPALVTPCASAPPAGMLCVPGGAFLMGADQFYTIGGGLDPTPEHLVQVHPFALDRDEVTVGQVRMLVRSRGLTEPLIGDPDPSAQPPECTYLGSTDASNDGDPVNCIAWASANQACQLLGKRLPTEAEWEFAASNVGQATSYPWGGDTDVCSHAVVGRGRLAVDLSTACLAQSTLFAPGPVPSGSATDASLLGLRNLGGNVSEWVADVFDPYTAPCWSTGANLLVDPLCTAKTGNPAQHSIRGGAWNLPPESAHSYARNVQRQDAPDVGIGLRCALSM